MTFTQLTKEEAKEEVKKSGAEIDQEVYLLYGLTKEETQIIEESHK